jgi:hypothetical protein
MLQNNYSAPWKPNSVSIYIHFKFALSELKLTSIKQEWTIPHCFSIVKQSSAVLTYIPPLQQEK